MAGSSVCLLSPWRGVSSLHRASLPAVRRASQREGCLERREPDQRAGSSIEWSVFTLTSRMCKSPACLHMYTPPLGPRMILCSAARVIFSKPRCGCHKIHMFHHLHHRHSLSPSVTFPGALRRTGLGARGWVMSGPGCALQPHPITPPDRTSPLITRTLHVPSAKGISVPASAWGTHTLLFPTLVLVSSCSAFKGEESY